MECIPKNIQTICGLLYFTVVLHYVIYRYLMVTPVVLGVDIPYESTNIYDITKSKLKHHRTISLYHADNCM